MAGHYRGGEQGSEGNRDGRQDAHREKPVDRQRDDDATREEVRREDSCGRDPETERRPQHEDPPPRDDDAGPHSRGGDEDNPEDRRSLQRGSGNYARDWLGQRSACRAPEDVRGGGFGGPQDSLTHRGHRSDEPDDGRVFAGMPSSVPDERAGDDHGGGSDGTGHPQADPVRTDERLKEIICERLSAEHAVDASEVSVEVSHGEVTVEGAVRDRATKHRIEDVIDACGGVREIHNRLRVQDRHRTSTSSHCVSGDTEQSGADRHESGQQPPAGTGKT